MLSACAAASRSPFFSTLANFRRSTTSAIDPKKVETLPYASMLAWFKGSSKALLVLGEYGADRRLVWYSADRQSVTTWGPFVLRLLGLDVGVRETVLGAGWSTDIRNLVGKTLEKSVVFQTSRNQVSMRTRSVFRDDGVEQVDLFGRQQRSLRKIREYVIANGTHRFANLYWIDDKSGFCWKSRQVLIPTMGDFNIEVAKPPRF